MKRFSIVPAIAAMVLAMFSCSVEDIDQAKQQAVVEEDSVPATEGTACICFSSEMADLIAESLKEAPSPVQTKSQMINSVMAEIGAVSLERVFPYDSVYDARHRAAGLHKFYKVKYDSSVPHTKASASLEGIAGVEKVEYQRRRIKQTSVEINDPYYTKKYQWSLFNNGTIYSGFRNGADINVLPVWEDFTAGTSNVIVAVVDGGISMTHPDLSAVVIAGGNNGSKNFCTGGYSISGSEHGTHVAGIIGAITNNNTGVAGVAGGLDGKGGVRLLSCQVFSDKKGEGASDQDFAAAIAWGADHGAVISNNSWGYDYDDNEDGKIDDKEYAAAKNDNLASYLTTAIDYFTNYAGMSADGKTQTGPMAGGVVLFSAGNDNIDFALPAKYDGCIAVGAMGPAGKRASYSCYGDWVDICAPGGEYVGYPSDEARPFVIGCYYDYEKSQDSYIFMCGTSQACPHVSGVAALLVSYFGGQGFKNSDLRDRLINGADYEFVKDHDKPVGPKVDAYAAFTYNPVWPDPLESVEYNPIRNEIEVTFKSVNAGSSLAHGYTLFLSEDRSLIENLLTSNIPEGVAVHKFKSEATSAGQTEKFVVSGLKHESTYYVRCAARSLQGLLSSLTPMATVTTPVNHKPVVKNPQNLLIESFNQKHKLDMSDFFYDEDGDVLTYTARSSSSKVATCSYSGSDLYVSSAARGAATVTITATDQGGASCTVKTTVLSRDPSIAFDLYPNPVEDVLNISAGQQASFNVTVSSSSGSVLLDREPLSGSAFNPATIDMTACAPGIYKLRIERDGAVYNYSVVKK